mmetsp:Transcript_14248/g.24416  ORF Transcript_14248/g.24416 Transcript_14248/m.24416 type:complete len:201 (-) Transcript_14248:66-668(-)
MWMLECRYAEQTPCSFFVFRYVLRGDNVGNYAISRSMFRSQTLSVPLKFQYRCLVYPCTAKFSALFPSFVFSCSSCPNPPSLSPLKAKLRNAINRPTLRHKCKRSLVISSTLVFNPSLLLLLNTWLFTLPSYSSNPQLDYTSTFSGFRNTVRLCQTGVDDCSSLVCSLTILFCPTLAHRHVHHTPSLVHENAHTHTLSQK